MKNKLVTAALTAMMITAGSASFSMPVFADAYGNYEVYDPETGEVMFINIYDYPGETIDSFLNKSGYQLVLGDVESQADIDQAEADFKASHQDAHYADNGYVNDVVENSSPAFGEKGTTQTTASDTQSAETSVTTATTQDTAPAASNATTTTTTASSSGAKTANKSSDANHGPFNGITEDAVNAFISFTSDGVADSCYIDINETSDNLVMPARAINYTKANTEDGIVNIVDSDGNAVISFRFPQVEATEDVNLAYTLENKDGVYTLTFEEDQDLGYNVIVTIPVSDKDMDYYIYDKDGNEFFTVTSDDKGYASFAIQTLQKYQLSKDVIEKTEEMATENAEENETEDIPVSEELTNEGTAEDVNEADAETEALDTQMPDEVAAPMESTNNQLASVPIVAAAAVAAIAAAWFVIFKKK